MKNIVIIAISLTSISISQPMMVQRLNIDQETAIQRIDAKKKCINNLCTFVDDDERPVAVDASNNQFKSIDEIGKYVKKPDLVQHIIADHNQIEKVDIDETLHKYPNLQSLKIAHNSLTSIKCSQFPPGFAFDASHNKLRTLPSLTLSAGSEAYIDLSNNYLSQDQCNAIKQNSVFAPKYHFSICDKEYKNWLKSMVARNILFGTYVGVLKRFEFQSSLDYISAVSSVQNITLFCSIITIVARTCRSVSLCKSSPNIINTSNQLALKVPTLRTTPIAKNKSDGLRELIY